MLKPIYYTIIFIVLFSSLLSQKKIDTKKRIDSLINATLEFPTVKSNADTIRKISLLAIGDALLLRDSIALISLYNNIGVSYYLEDNLNKSLEFFQISARLIDENQKPKEKGVAFQNISQIHDINNNTERAMLYSNKSIDLLEKSGAKRELAVAYLNRGSLEHKLENHGNARTFFKKSLTIREKINDSIGIAHCKNNLGLINLDYKNYREGLFNFKEAYSIFQDLDIIEPQLKIAGNIYICYTNIGIKDSAKLFLDSIEYLVHYIEFNSESKQEAYSILGEYYEKSDQYEKALHYKNLYLNEKLALDSINSQDQYLKLEKDFTHKQLEEKAKLINSKKSKSPFYLIILILIVIVAFTFYFIPRKKKKEVSTSSEQIANQYNLTSREIEILIELLKGKSSPEIAEKLFISLNTVNTHRKNIYKKINVSSSSELLIWANNKNISL